MLGDNMRTQYAVNAARLGLDPGDDAAMRHLAASRVEVSKADYDDGEIFIARTMFPGLEK